MKSYRLGLNNKSVELKAGQTLEKWQIENICQVHGDNYEAMIKDLLSDPADGWTKEGVYQFIVFLESKDIKKMFPEMN